MEELHSLDPRRQELLEARFTGGVSGNTGGSTGSTSGGTKVTDAQREPRPCFYRYAMNEVDSRERKTMALDSILTF